MLKYEYWIKKHIEVLERKCLKLILTDQDEE